MSDRHVFRYSVPVDDRWHTLGLSGAVLHVACRQPDVVEVWALNTGGPELPRVFRVFGTGQCLAAGTRHRRGPTAPMRPLPRVHAFTDGAVLSLPDFGVRAAAIAAGGSAIALHARDHDGPVTRLVAGASRLVAPRVGPDRV